MEGPWVRGTSGGGCHVRRATPALDIAAFPGHSGDWPMGHWWSQPPCEYQWRVGWSLARQGGAAMWGEPLRLSRSLPWGLWRLTDGPLMITAPPMEGRLVAGTSGGGLPWEESHSGSRHHSLPWGLWRMTDGPLMITAPLRISMEGPVGS